MEIGEYPSNSHKSREAAEQAEEKKPLEKVVSGEVKTRKKTGISKLASSITSEDIGKVLSYLATDVLVPKIKETISGIVTNGIDMLLYGESGRPKNSRNETTSYSSYYKRPSERFMDTKYRDVYAYDDIIIPTRGEAENVIRALRDQLSEYGIVSVSDLYDLVGIRGTFVDCKYGWTDLKTAYVDRVRDGYILKLPKAREL